ncbi:MAG: alpha-2-macroglobulin family protein [Myxococcota bacterium]
MSHHRTMALAMSTLAYACGAQQGMDSAGAPSAPGMEMAAAEVARTEMEDGASTPVREFARPLGEAAPVRRDFRETVFWAPSIRTDESGEAKVSFQLSDAVTTFRVTAEGVADSAVGRSEANLVSTLPLAIRVRPPVAVTEGDRVELPITLSNNRSEPVWATLQTRTGDAFGTGSTLEERVWLGPNRSRTLHRPLTVERSAPTADRSIAIRVRADGFEDALEREISIGAPGFPTERAWAGTLQGRARHTVAVPADATSVELTATLYPSTVATLMQGTESIIREPSGCFEQASSSNYPNVMVMNYLRQHDAANDELRERVEETLASGYAKLTGYESSAGGYEWFGGSPGHEALTAYGLMQFRDMAEVYGSVDQAMIDRTARWIQGRRNGNGGYDRNDRALDSFGAASPEVTDAYITYALVEAGYRDLDTELTQLRNRIDATDDSYVLALIANALLSLNGADPDGRAALEKLIGHQAQDGRIGHADHSITRSGGQALDIETTALGALAMLKADARPAAPLEKAIQYVESQRSGSGGFASTQATVLALKALTTYAENARGLPDGAVIEAWVNGERVATVGAEDADDDGAIAIGGLGAQLRHGGNVVELRAGDVELPYALGFQYRRHAATPNPRAQVAIETRLRAPRIQVGASVRLQAVVENRTAGGLPMVVARVGIPGGLESQTWQLDELREQALIDFYETREREVTLYWRAMAPNARREVPIELLAAVPGTYTAAPSAAYLYYTAEHKNWAAPLPIEIQRPSRRNR